MLVIHTLILLLATAAAYSLSRFPKTPKVDGYPAIPVPKKRLVAPGQRATMHIYDASSMEVMRYAQAHENSTYGQVVIDEAAMQDRRFAVEEVGSRIKVLSVTPSTHTDKFGGTSGSMMAEVIGVGLLTPTAVLQKMPFMTVEAGDCPLLGDGVCSVGDEGAAAALSDAAALCQGLEEVASFKGALTKESETKAEGGAWSVSECVQRVLELRDCEGAGDGTRVLLSALAATAYLPEDVRFDAMQRAARGEGAAAVELVAAALDEESRRRLALKALSGLGGE